MLGEFPRPHFGHFRSASFSAMSQQSYHVPSVLAKGRAIPGLPRRFSKPSALHGGSQASAISSKLVRLNAVKDSDDSVDMIVSRMYERLVGYVVAEVLDAESNEVIREPVGTLFFIEHSVGPGAGVIRYAVTCRHVIEEFKRYESPKSLFVRVNNINGFQKILQSAWMIGFSARRSILPLLVLTCLDYFNQS